MCYVQSANEDWTSKDDVDNCRTTATVNDEDDGDGGGATVKDDEGETDMAGKGCDKGKENYTAP